MARRLELARASLSPTCVNSLEVARRTGRFPHRGRQPVLLTFCRWAPTLLQNICRRVALRQRLIYYKGRSTF